MKRKVNKKNYTEEENFGRKPQKGQVQKDKSSKRRLSIYDEFEDEDLEDYRSYKNQDEFDDEDEDVND